MKYPYIVYQTQVEDHVFWVAKCSALNGCVGQGDTLEEALLELQENETEWLATAAECGIAIPEIPLVQENVCSGKFTVRVSPVVHQDAIECAREQGISLNQYVNDAIVAQNVRNTTMQMVKQEIRRTIFDTVLSLPSSLSSGQSNQRISFQQPLVANLIN